MPANLLFLPPPGPANLFTTFFHPPHVHWPHFPCRPMSASLYCCTSLNQEAPPGRANFYAWEKSQLKSTSSVSLSGKLEVPSPTHSSKLCRHQVQCLLETHLYVLTCQPHEAFRGQGQVCSSLECRCQAEPGIESQRALVSVSAPVRFGSRWWIGCRPCLLELYRQGIQSWGFPMVCLPRLRSEG